MNGQLALLIFNLLRNKQTTSVIFRAQDKESFSILESAALKNWILSLYLFSFDEPMSIVEFQFDIIEHITCMILFPV